MNSILSQDLWLHSRSFLQEDVVIRELLLSHDPDGRHLDSEQLLRAMENIMCYATASEVLVILCSATLLLWIYMFFYILFIYSFC